MTGDSLDFLSSFPILWILVLASLVLSVAAVSASWRQGRTRRTAERASPEPERRLLREFEKNGQSADTALVKWTPATLRRVLAEELPGAQVIVVSNREPYIHDIKKDGAVDLVVPASGLVSALEPITRACAGTWIARASAW